MSAKKQHRLLVILPKAGLIAQDLSQVRAALNENGDVEGFLWTVEATDLWEASSLAHETARTLEAIVGNPVTIERLLTTERSK